MASEEQRSEGMNRKSEERREKSAGRGKATTGSLLSPLSALPSPVLI